MKATKTKSENCPICYELYVRGKNFGLLNLNLTKSLTKKDINEIRDNLKGMKAVNNLELHFRR